VLAFAILLQGVELIIWGRPQVSEFYSRVEHSELPARDRNEVGGKTFRTTAMENRFRYPIPESADHAG
jgi:hypothetical protein